MSEVEKRGSTTNTKKTLRKQRIGNKYCLCVRCVFLVYFVLLVTFDSLFFFNSMYKKSRPSFQMERPGFGSPDFGLNFNS